MGTHPIFESDFDCLTEWSSLTIMAMFFFAVSYAVILNFWLSSNVMKARKQYKVEYPAIYHKDPMHIFNCYQRAHQNTLEYFPFVMIQFAAMACVNPKLASIFFSIWVTARFFYAQGYYTGEPSKRMRGVFGYIGFFGMFFYNIYTGYTLLF